MTVPLRVETHAGHKADERPVRVWLADRAVAVLEVVDRWYAPDDDWFRVRVEGGDLYVLRHHRPSDEWTIAAYTRAR